MALPNSVQKNPSEVLNIAVDFTYRLAVGETISSATAAVISPATITVDGTPTVATPIVICVVSAGTDGKTDSFEALATTSTGEILAAVVDVAVSGRDF